MDLLHSAIARKAFDIAAEPAKLRERYGMHAWGQRCLLARRLVEHGASFVTMVLENPYQSGLPAAKDGTYNWDSHAVNCHICQRPEKSIADLRPLRVRPGRGPLRPRPG